MSDEQIVLKGSIGKFELNIEDYLKATIGHELHHISIIKEDTSNERGHSMNNILHEKEFLPILNKLSANDQPLFGIMTPQHMVEHLVLFVRFSNGKLPQNHNYPEEKEQQIKAFLLNNAMPIGFKSPVLPTDKPIALEYPCLQTAIENLLLEIDYFENYFKENPLASPINPTMGALNYSEWEAFHYRHFTHHFTQFNLL